MSKEKLLLLGYGDIAKRLAEQLKNEYTITGVRRRTENSDIATIVQADCRDGEAMNTLLKENFDVITLTMTPGEMGDEAYRRAYVETVQTLLNALNQQVSQPRLIVFVSSSSVYGQKNAEWVDESSITEPSGYSGKRLLEAENLLYKSQYPTCSVRFSGIYGPGRQRLIEQVVQGCGTNQEPVLYSNRIHADDCAGVLAHLIQKQKNKKIEPLYLASDCEPSPLYEVKHWLAEALGLPADHLQVASTESRLRSSKRCNNRRLLESGYSFQYPTFKEGYTAVLQKLELKDGELTHK